MTQFYCADCNDPIEPHKPFYGKAVRGMWVHQGENYLVSQSRATLDQEDRNQLKAWAHQVKPIDGHGNRMDMIGRQFRNRY